MPCVYVGTIPLQKMPLEGFKTFPTADGDYNGLRVLVGTVLSCQTLGPCSLKVLDVRGQENMHVSGFIVEEFFSYCGWFLFVSANMEFTGNTRVCLSRLTEIVLIKWCVMMC